MRIDERTNVPLKFIGFLLLVATPCTVWFVRLEAQAKSNADAIQSFRIKEDALVFELHQIDKRLAGIEGELRRIRK